MEFNQISDYIENLPLKKSFCKGYRPDEVYDVICNLSSMYNQILSEVYEEKEALGEQLKHLNADNTCPPSLHSEKKLMSGIENRSINFEDRQEEIVTGKELQKLKRGELLEILLEQTRENEALKSKLEESTKIIYELHNQLENRRIDIKKAGNIADASLKLNGVFDVAQKAAQQYLDNLQELYNQEARSFSQREAEIEIKCTALLQETKAQCDSMRKDVEQTCRKREEEAENRCRELDLKAKEAVDKRWDELAKRLEAFYNTHDV